MKSWKVIEKYAKRIDAGSHELHLRVERGGVERDVVVSGATYYPATVGGEVSLAEHSGTSEDKLRELEIEAHGLRTEVERLRVLAVDEYARGWREAVGCVSMTRDTYREGTRGRAALDQALEDVAQMERLSAENAVRKFQQACADADDGSGPKPVAGVSVGAETAEAARKALGES